jgi:hypothetical protein
MGFKPSSSFGDLTEKKPMPSKTAVPKESFTSHKPKEKAVQPAQASSTANEVNEMMYLLLVTSYTGRTIF